MEKRKPAAGENMTPDANRRASIEAKKVYLKDASFESPASPDVFAKEKLEPKIDVQMSLTHRRIDREQFYEIVLSATVNAVLDGATVFVAEVQQAGIFEIRHLAEDKIESALETACPHILLPFAREALASIVSKGGFPQVLLSPINFQAVYQQKKAAQKDGRDASRKF